jgi:hypothetical protein
VCTRRRWRAQVRERLKGPNSHPTDAKTQNALMKAKEGLVCELQLRAVPCLSQLGAHAVCGISRESHAPEAAALQLLVAVPAAAVKSSVCCRTTHGRKCFGWLQGERTLRMPVGPGCGTVERRAPWLATPALSAFVRRSTGFDTRGLPE